MLLHDTLSCHGINDPKMQEEESFKLHSEIDNSKINNIKLTIQICTALIFKVQKKKRYQETKRKGVSPATLFITMHKMPVICFVSNTKDLHSSIIDTKSTVMIS
jgi:hypothetical protein